MVAVLSSGMSPSPGRDLGLRRRKVPMCGAQMLSVAALPAVLAQAGVPASHLAGGDVC